MSLSSAALVGAGFAGVADAGNGLPPVGELGFAAVDGGGAASRQAAKPSCGHTTIMGYRRTTPKLALWMLLPALHGKGGYETSEA